MRAPRVVKMAMAAVACAVVIGSRSPEVAAVDHHTDKHVSWTEMNPVCEAEQRPVSMNDHDVTFVVKPIRVDVDEVAPGRHEARAVRLHVRALQKGGGEQTIAWERGMFRSEEDMRAFKRRLEPLMTSPIVSLRVRAIEDKKAPEWNKRWRATDMPYWTEIPVY